MFESKSYRDQRKSNSNISTDKKKKIDSDKKENIGRDDDEDNFKKEKRDKFKESPREQKSKKYSDSRKDRVKQNDFMKSDKQSVLSKMMSSDGKNKLNHDDIKPFTQLPQVKTDDLTKLIEGMEKKSKLDDSKVNKKNEIIVGISKMRRNSLESGEVPVKEESVLKRQKSLEDRSKSTDREGSEEKEKSESTERRAERRIRNKVGYLICMFFD